MSALVQILAEAEKSKTPFFLVGGGLAAWAVILAFVGLTRHDFPGTASIARGVMAISAILVVAAMATAVAVS
jgi:hypothetical protein